MTSTQSGSVLPYDVEVTPPLLAKRMGWSRWKAWRWMRETAQKRPDVVQQCHRTLVGKASRIAAVLPGFTEPSPLEREVVALRKRTGELERRLDQLTREFRLKSHMWLTK